MIATETAERKREYPFVYFVYNRGDFEDFQRRVDGLVADREIGKDIVIDYSSYRAVGVMDVRFLARESANLKTIDPQRQLRIVANPSLKKTLQALKIDQLENVVLYESRQEFAERLRESF